MTTLDVSIYDWPTFAPPCFKANGVERLIVGASNLNAARQMVGAGRDAGLIVEDLYAFCYYGLGWESRDLDNCLRIAEELGGIKRIWLDCEAGFSDDSNPNNDTEAPGITVEYRQAATRDQRQRVEAANLQVGIYTGAFWWTSKMGNTTEFSDLPLWLANYGTNDPNNPRSPITEVNFGGWTATAAHQFSSTIGLCGRDVRDHNYWFLEEDEMSAEDIARIDRLEKLLAANGIAKDPAAYVASGYDPALLTFGEEAVAYAAERGWSAFLGTGLNQADIAAHKADQPGGVIAPGTKFTSEVIS